MTAFFSCISICLDLILKAPTKGYKSLVFGITTWFKSLLKLKLKVCTLITSWFSVFFLIDCYGIQNPLLVALFKYLWTWLCVYFSKFWTLVRAYCEKKIMYYSVSELWHFIKLCEQYHRSHLWLGRHIRWQAVIPLTVQIAKNNLVMTTSSRFQNSSRLIENSGGNILIKLYNFMNCSMSASEMPIIISHSFIFLKIVMYTEHLCTLFNVEWLWMILRHRLQRIRHSSWPKYNIVSLKTIKSNRQIQKHCKK